MADIVQHPIGTPLFFVPIRYWESPPIETGRVALHKGIEPGEVWDSFTEDGFVYAFHDGYGHNVYMQSATTFLTLEEATAERDRLAVEYEAKQKAEFDAWWEKMTPTFLERGRVI